MGWRPIDWKTFSCATFLSTLFHWFHSPVALDCSTFGKFSTGFVCWCLHSEVVWLKLAAIQTKLRLAASSLAQSVFAKNGFSPSNLRAGLHLPLVYFPFSNNMLYPKENRAERKLMLSCRNCNHEEKATSSCVYVGDLRGAGRYVVLWLKFWCPHGVSFPSFDISARNMSVNW